MSYTSFSIKIIGVELNGSKVLVHAKVKNIGGHSEKEVVQAYVSHNGGSVYQELVAFAKTKNLEPNEEQKLTLSFKLEDSAVYNESAAEYLLYKGDYVLRIGNSSKNTDIASIFNLSETVVTEKCKNCCIADKKNTALEAKIQSEILSEDVPYFVVDKNAFKTIVYKYGSISFIETAEEKATLDSLTTDEMIELVRGADLQTMPIGSVPLRGNGGKTATTLLHKNITNITAVDGPAGLNIFNHVAFIDNRLERTVSIPERFNWSVLTKYAPSVPENAVHIYRYATAWPIEMLLAQTWNIEILHKIGCSVGEEMTDFGVSVWLAPGMNLHRNPLCGRNFEYYSEDPYLTGKMAVALISGVQFFKDKAVTIKHFLLQQSRG